MTVVGLQYTFMTWTKSKVCSVLERFQAVNWNNESRPDGTKNAFIDKIQALRSALDAAQEASTRLDNAWGRLTQYDLCCNDQTFKCMTHWWQALQKTETATEQAHAVRQRYQQAFDKMRAAEELLQHWVIRHRKSEVIAVEGKSIKRRQRFVGNAIADESSNSESGDQTGLPVRDTALLPFLLAARATACAPQSRPVFAEGLASSYEAFLYTRLQNIERQNNAEGLLTTDLDDDAAPQSSLDRTGEWYLNQLATFIPKDDPVSSFHHPKILTTVKKTVDLWLAGEKVLVFCHFIATGRVLRSHLSDAIRQEIINMGEAKIRCHRSDVLQELNRLGLRFFDTDSPIRQACDKETKKLLKI